MVTGQARTGKAQGQDADSDGATGCAHSPAPDTGAAADSADVDSATGELAETDLKMDV